MMAGVPRSRRLRAGPGRWEWRRATRGPPSRSRRVPAPRLLVRPRAQPRTPSGGVEAVTGGTGLCWPCEEWGALGLRPREQRRDGAQPHGQTAAHRARSSLGPSGCLPQGILHSPSRLPPPLETPGARWFGRPELCGRCVLPSGPGYSRLGPRRGGGRRALHGLA